MQYEAIEPATEHFRRWQVSLKTKPMQYRTSQNTKAYRVSNMELLRLISMFLVLVIHANTAFSPWPINQTDVNATPFHCIFRFLIESISVVCVNSFILLSGWFEIKFSFKKLFALIFQVLFFSLLMTFLPNNRGQGIKLFVDIFTLNQYWFVRAYLILFILSPALNIFAEKAPKDMFRYVLIAFFAMQTIFSYISNSGWFDDGFSPIPFFGLYLLARYIRIHKPVFSSFNKATDILIYLGAALLMTIGSILLFKWFGSGGRMFNYTNPLVIIASVFFVLFFSKLSMKQSPVINWIAVSSVGAYLLHMNPLFFNSYYIGTLHSFSNHQSCIMTISLALGFMILVFLTGVLLDKIRSVIWKWGLMALHIE